MKWGTHLGVLTIRILVTLVVSVLYRDSPFSDPFLDTPESCSEACNSLSS